jgi:xylulose-5-phosphate/fructose-6-phosphate phosphoketolase
MDDISFEPIFTEDVRVIFLPWVIHPVVHGWASARLLPRTRVPGQRHADDPFDMVVLNNVSRLQLAIDAVKYLTRRRPGAAAMVFVGRLAPKVVR